MTERTLQRHFATHHEVVARTLQSLGDEIVRSAEALSRACFTSHKVLAFGNGGSAAQASHLVGELLGRYQQTRRPIAAICLTAETSVLSGVSNDFGFESVFERQLEALTQPGDVAIGFSTSGRSTNVLRGMAMAERKGALTIALTGSAGLLGGQAQHILAVPNASTAHIQEVHLMIIHIWCQLLDDGLESC